MKCRDVRALRGDRDGISIPFRSPPAVVFPESLGAGHLGVVLSHLLAFRCPRLNPRPIYLIFENSGPESAGLHQIRLFRKVALAGPGTG